MIDNVLVIPFELARVGVKSERAVVIEVLLIVSGKQEFWRGRSYRRPDINKVSEGSKLGGIHAPT